MAGTPIAIWVDGHALSAANLDSLETNVFTTMDQLIGTPRSAAWDMNAQTLILSGDQGESIRGTVDNVITFQVKTVDLFQMHGDTTDPVNGLDLIAGATGTAVQIKFVGDAAASINIVPGTGDLQVNGGSMSPLAWQVYGG